MAGSGSDGCGVGVGRKIAELREVASEECPGIGELGVKRAWYGFTDYVSRTIARLVLGPFLILIRIVLLRTVFVKRTVGVSYRIHVRCSRSRSHTVQAGHATVWATHAVSVLKGLALSGRREHTQTTPQK